MARRPRISATHVADEQKETITMKYVVYREHHSGKSPEERLRYREINSGSDHQSFASRGRNPVPQHVVPNARDRIITNIHKAAQFGGGKMRDED